MVHRSACPKDGIYWSAGDKLLGSQCLMNAPDLGKAEMGAGQGQPAKGWNGNNWNLRFLCIFKISLGFYVLDFGGKAYSIY